MSGPVSDYGNEQTRQPSPDQVLPRKRVWATPVVINPTELALAEKNHLSVETSTVGVYFGPS